MRIATHDGSFHADEVFAVATLQLLGEGPSGVPETVEVLRTRDRELIAGADLRIDVGFRDEPETGDFDHHQRSFERARPNGVRYASFGLIWREFGARVCGGDAHVADAVDATLVQSVDAADSGQRLAELIVDDVHPMTIGGVIGGLNARWDETLTPAEERARFDQAVELARGVLAREVAAVASARRAVRVVEEAIEAAADPRLVQLPVNAPWKRVLVPAAPQALYVIYPKRQGFGLEGVPRELGSFELRRELPATWAGLEGEELVAATGVADAVFCHRGRFLVVARSRAGIGRLAQLALSAA
ncbi:MAG TPA: MYG1 family protein [Solirubrobacteraceae bacterium]|nr:MYG1 family protein [Solirubrobacteraceae bacterium]